jgi:predicted transcriptional regulator
MTLDSWGRPLKLEDLTVEGEDALKVADALTSTSLAILQLLSERRLDITEIAERLRLSQPYVSEQIIRLEESKLVRVSYERGKKGTKKLCELAVERIIIRIKPESGHP